MRPGDFAEPAVEQREVIVGQADRVADQLVDRVRSGVYKANCRSRTGADYSQRNMGPHGGPQSAGQLH